MNVSRKDEILVINFKRTQNKTMKIPEIMKNLKFKNKVVLDKKKGP